MRAYWAARGTELLVVGKQAHQLLRQEEHDGGKGQGDGPGHIAAQADDPVNGLGVPLPQNWLMRTEEPLWSPKMTSWMTKTGMLATSTAARGASPRAPP